MRERVLHSTSTLTAGLRSLARAQVTKCTGEVDGDYCLGSEAKRSALATVTVSPISQYRTNTERQRMKEAGQERNVDVLWLLTLSAPAGSWDAALRERCRAIAASFEVP